MQAPSTLKDEGEIKSMVRDSLRDNANGGKVIADNLVGKGGKKAKLSA